jgi:hypothetical protein
MKDTTAHLSLEAARLLVTLLRLDTDGDGIVETVGTLHWQRARIWPFPEGCDPYRAEAELEARGEVLRLDVLREDGSRSDRKVYILRQRLTREAVA